MTTHRDPDALLSAYLADGMSVLPDRVVDAVLDEVHRTRQRAVFGLWRTRPMFKIGLAAAGVVAVVFGGGALLSAFNPPPNTGTQSPTPVATQAATPATTLAPSPTPGLPAFPGPGPQIDLVNGMTYQATPFSQPMTLTLPDVTAELGPGAVVNGHTYGGGGHTMQITYPDSDPEKRGIAITIHDDFKIDVDLCNPDGKVQSVPATPEAVGEWLHALEPGPDDGSSQPNVVTDQPDIVVDGRVAKVYDVTLGSGCGDAGAVGDVSTYSYQSHRFYAIPTGTDTILVINWNQPGILPRETVNAISDRLVASFTFE
jgi:hypothetical protein